MSALLDLHPDGTHPVLSGVAEIEAVLDRMLASPTMVLETGDYAAVVTGLERVSRRLDALKLRMVAAADKAGAARDAGFTGTDAWLAKTTDRVPCGRGPTGRAGHRAGVRARRHRRRPWTPGWSRPDTPR